MRFRMTTTTEAPTVDGMLQEIVDCVVDAVQQDSKISVEINNRPEDSPRGGTFMGRVRTDDLEIRITSMIEDKQQAVAEDAAKPE